MVNNDDKKNIVFTKSGIHSFWPAILILITMLSFIALSSAAADDSALVKLVSQIEDPQMSVRGSCILFGHT